jgi:predicted amidohydrolase
MTAHNLYTMMEEIMRGQKIVIKCVFCILFVFFSTRLLPAHSHAVRILSLCFNQGSQTVDAICRIVDREAARGIDLVCLPEAWTGSEPESINGQTVVVMTNLAKKHHTYIICPLIIKRDQLNYNASILIDREGKIAGVYHKIFPYWSEFEGTYPVQPAQNDAAVFDTDFGKVGLSICYDAKFPEVFQRLRDQGADLIVWSSAYSGFTELQAFANLHHYYIVTSTWTGDCLVYDINGENILDKSGPGDLTAAYFELDMDRQIYHYNFNQDKLKQLLRDHGGEVVVDCDMPREEWFVLKAKRAQISVRTLAKQYGLETLRDYIHRSRQYINGLRGFDFSEKYGGYPH